MNVSSLMIIKTVEPFRIWNDSYGSSFLKIAYYVTLTFFRPVEF